MKRLGIAFAGIMLLATMARAQTAADTQSMEKCLTAADEKQVSGITCVGSIADSCIRAASQNDPDGQQAKKCAARELSVWSALMKQALAGIRNGGFAEITKAANTSQEAWAKSTAALCPAFDKVDPGMAAGGANYCRLEATDYRVLMLRKLAAAVSEH